MSWVQRKRLKAFLKTSLWVVPVLAMLLAMICAPLTRSLNDALHFRFLDFGLQGSRAVVGLIAAAMLTFVVFFFSVLLLTIQVASGSLSPRIIARPFQSSVLKASLGLFVFTFVYGASILGRLEEHVLQLPVFLSLLLTVVCIGDFLFVVEYIGKELRPVTVVSRVAREGLAVIRDVYPRGLSRTSDPPPDLDTLLKENCCRCVKYHGRPGVIIAFDVAGLVQLAEQHRCVIELVPQVGDFVSTGAPLFRVHGDGTDIHERELHGSIAVGRERTLEQDPAFAFRIIVDIAEKALSPAINDPTTGVLSIDQIQCLLQEVGTRDLNTGLVRDQGGSLRLVYPTPAWEDFVLLSVAEIRQYGGNSLQVVRRLRAMLEGLIALLPPERVPLLRQQLDLLHLTVEEEFSHPADREQAGIPDSQGLGGRIASHASFKS
jgi:uncharacterized membrane protein